jgi:hypothetical protein
MPPLFPIQIFLYSHHFLLLDNITYETKYNLNNISNQILIKSLWPDQFYKANIFYKLIFILLFLKFQIY